MTVDFGGIKLSEIYNMTTREFFGHLGIDITFLQNHPLFDLDDTHGSNCSKVHDWVVQNMLADPKRKHQHPGDPRQNATGVGLFYPFSLPRALRPSSDSLCPGDGRRPVWYTEDRRCLCCNNGLVNVRGCKPGPIIEGKCKTCQAYGRGPKPRKLACFWANPLCFISTKDAAKVFEGGRYAGRAG